MQQRHSPTRVNAVVFIFTVSVSLKAHYFNPFNQILMRLFITLLMQSLCEMTETCLMSPPIHVSRKETTWNGLKIYNFTFSKINPCAVPLYQMCPRIGSTCPKIKIVYLILRLCHIVLYVYLQYIAIECTFITLYHFISLIV